MTFGINTTRGISKIVSQFTHLTAREMTYNNFEISLVEYHCGERFKKDTVSVTGFTGFVWTKRRFELKGSGFENTRIGVDGA